MKLFFSENSTDFVFQKLPKENQSKIVYVHMAQSIPQIPREGGMGTLGTDF